jgi:hypothetical protein
LIHKIRSTNTQIQHVYFLNNCIIKSIKKPRCIRYLNNSFISYPKRLKTPTWLFVNTLKICNCASGAMPKHSLLLPITPATNNPWPIAKTKHLNHWRIQSNIYFHTIMFILLISPICHFSNIRKMWMTILNTCIKYGYMNSTT